MGVCGEGKLTDFQCSAAGGSGDTLAESRRIFAFLLMFACRKYNVTNLSSCSQFSSSTPHFHSSLSLSFYPLFLLLLSFLLIQFVMTDSFSSHFLPPPLLTRLLFLLHLFHLLLFLPFLKTRLPPVPSHSPPPQNSFHLCLFPLLLPPVFPPHFLITPIRAGSLKDAQIGSGKPTRRVKRGDLVTGPGGKIRGRHPRPPRQVRPCQTGPGQQTDG